MENYDNIFEISEETVAAWLDGCLSSEDDLAFVERISSDFQLAEILDAYEDIEADFEHIIEDGYELPSELSFDFNLPDIVNEDDYLFMSANSTTFGYSDDINSESIQDTNEESNEFYDQSDVMQSEDFFLF